MASIIKKVSETKVKSDKNGREYKTCTFAKMQATEVNVPGVGLVAVHEAAKETSVNLYAESYLDNKEQFGYSIPANTEKHSFLFGDIVTRKVNSYVINSVDKTTGEVTEREVDTFTTVVFGNSDSPSWESTVKSTFRSRGHYLAISDAAMAAVQANESTQSYDLSGLIA